MPNTEKTKIKKVVATVTQEFVEPDDIARWKCPHCKAQNREELFKDNYTETKTCHKCGKEYKVKIPKFY